MAFSYTVGAPNYIGNKRLVSGTYANAGGSTGGDILTALSNVESFKLTPSGATVQANAPVVNETFPLVNSTGAVTVVTDANEGGYWEATGV